MLNNSIITSNVRLGIDLEELGHESEVKKKNSHKKGLYPCSIFFEFLL